MMQLQPQLQQYGNNAQSAEQKAARVVNFFVSKVSILKSQIMGTISRLISGQSSRSPSLPETVTVQQVKERAFRQTFPNKSSFI